MRDRTRVKVDDVERKEDAPARSASAPSGLSPLLAMQGSAGNAAVVKMLGESGIQPKLRVGAVDDPAEREADAVADAVLGGLRTGTLEDSDGIGRRIRRRPGGGGGDAPGHGLEGGPVDAGVEQQIEAARGGGAALSAADQQTYGTALGADLSGVRVHTGGQADNLNRALNAKAFTTGSDIFFANGAMDERTMVHELAHTVQSGASGPVRRFMSTKDFENLTYESMFTMASTAQKEITKLLQQYAALAKVKTDDTGTAGNKGTASNIVVPPDKVDNAIVLINQMIMGTEGWLKKNEKEGGNKNPKRKKGFEFFLGMAKQELVRLENQKASFIGPQAKIEVDETAGQKMKDHYEGNLGTILETISGVIGSQVASDGDQLDFEANCKIPIPPMGFVGAILRFEAKRDGKQTEVGCEAAFQGGVQLGPVDVHAALGGYFKASGPTAERAMKLVSYGFYRRCKESDVIPSSISSKIWGGNTGSDGAKKAEDWSKQVETDELGEGSNSFVETGGLAEVGAKFDGGDVAEAEGAAKYTSGKRYDAESMKKKGGAGQENTGLIFGQDSIGRSTHNLELSAKASFLGGIIAGDTKLQWSWRATSDNKKATLEDWEFQLRASGRLPIDDSLASKIVQISSDAVLTTRGVLKKQWDQASTTSKVGKGAQLAYGTADSVVVGVKGLPTADVIKNVIEGKSATQKADAKEPSMTKGALGVEVAMKIAGGPNKPTQATFELRHLKANSVKVPTFLQIELVKRQRLIGARYAGGTNNGTGEWSLLT